MLVCKNKEDVIALFNEANKPLDEGALQSLEKISQELAEQNLPPEWVVIELECRVCGWKDLGIMPKVNNLENVECLNCDNSTMQESDEPEFWQKDE